MDLFVSNIQLSDLELFTRKQGGDKGVYFLYDGDMLIYIGMATKSIYTRINSHNIKFTHYRRIILSDSTDKEIAAIEKQLIKQFLPIDNLELYGAKRKPIKESLKKLFKDRGTAQNIDSLEKYYATICEKVEPADFIYSDKAKEYFGFVSEADYNSLIEFVGNKEKVDSALEGFQKMYPSYIDKFLFNFCKYSRRDRPVLDENSIIDDDTIMTDHAYEGRKLKDIPTRHFVDLVKKGCIGLFKEYAYNRFEKEKVREPSIFHHYSKMPFGKFKDELLGNVPAWYLLWLLDNNKSGSVKDYIKDNKSLLIYEEKNKTNERMKTEPPIRETFNDKMEKMKNAMAIAT